jgi:hypothetical protein
MKMNKDNFFDAIELHQLSEEYVKVPDNYERLLTKYFRLNLKNRTAAEYCKHGFLRRLQTLKRCIENIYTICPPERSVKLKDNDRLDLTINLQSFIFNVYGCLDNLAGIWVNEKQLKDKNGCLLRGIAVGLMDKKRNKMVRESFSPGFYDYLNSLTPWYNEYLKEYRHALAHRIPPYIPPVSLNPEEFKQFESLETQKVEARRQKNFKTLGEIIEEQNRLGQFAPLMKHSYGENSSPVVFHAQILADWNTIVEIAEKFLDEFSSTKQE